MIFFTRNPIFSKLVMTEQKNTFDYNLASYDNSSLPAPLKTFYDSFKDKTPGEYTMGIGAGMDNIPFGPVTITVDNTRVSVILTSEYESSSNKNLEFIILQGYAQITIFDRFYASCVLIGNSSPTDITSVVNLVDYLTRTEEERERLEQQKKDEVKIHPSFYTSNYNDPVNDAISTYGIYIITDKQQGITACETVFQAIGVADFADNTAFGLAIAVSANVNTFTNTMSFTVAGSIRLADSERITIAGEVGILNGKLNSIGFLINSKLLVATEIYLTRGQFSVCGFQEPKTAISFGGGMAFGSEIKVPDGLGAVKKALFPNLTKFHPVELTVNCEINPMRSYYSFTGKGTFMGNIAVSASVTYDEGNWDAELKAGTVRNKYLNGSLTVDYHKRADNWNVHGNFNCSITVDFGKFVGISVSGGVDLRLNSQNYTVSNKLYNRKDLTITVSGMGKVKLFFSFNISVQKTWVFHLSNTQLAATEMLMNSITDDVEYMLENSQDVLVCESEDITEIELPQLRAGSDVIDVKSWQIDEECSASGIVRFQVAAEYTLVDSTWRLIHSAGDTVTVYTSENADGIVELQQFTHNYYELLINTPSSGNWTLEILGDSNNSGGIYMDALKDEKFITELKIVEQTASAIKFRYSAFTGSADDTTLVRLYAEEISDTPGENPFAGVIAYLEETENGEFVWEIPDDFRCNANYRFYISGVSSDAGTPTASSPVETFIARQKADLSCSWALAYSADNTDTVTAFITITNDGAESTTCTWQLLDYTNSNSADGEILENTASEADIIASGSGIAIQGNSSVTFQQTIQITDELRDNPSNLQFAVFRPSGTDDEIVADDADDITFAAMDSMFCQKQQISWQEIDGAASYTLQYALEGNWNECGVYITNIKGTSYTLSVAPGEYAWRVIAMDSSQCAIGSWSEPQIIEVLFSESYEINVHREHSSFRSGTFSLNDGIYNLNASNTKNFTGTLTLFRNDLVKSGEENDTALIKQIENKIVQLEFINGNLKSPISEFLLDNGEYFWEYSSADNGEKADSVITAELSGEVFSMEQKDREIISIDDDPQMPKISGVYVETLKGEVGFCNRDAIYQYMTDDGGELSITIKSGTVFDAKLNIHIFVQNSSDDNFSCEKTLTVNQGEYTDDTMILERLAVKNNFYVEIESWDNGKGLYNTDYCFDLSFDIFEDNVQQNDILLVNGDSIRDWIGYRNEEHSYLLQIKENGHYAVRLQGDAFDAVLKVCEVNGNIIDEKNISADGTAYIDNIELESGNYFVIVDSTDKGEGAFNTDYILNAYELKTLYPNIDNSDDTLEKASLLANSEFNTVISNWLGTGDSSDFFKFALTDTAQDASLLLSFDSNTAQAVSDGVLEIICCDRWGQSLTVDAISSDKWLINADNTDTHIYIGVLLNNTVSDIDYSFKLSAEFLPGNLSGNAGGLSWDAVPGAQSYIAEYSLDNFVNILTMETSGNKISTYALPSGTYQWRVKVEDGEIESTGADISTQYSADGPQKFVSDADGNTDVFFANASGIWENGYLAQHSGMLNSWNGTGEQAALAGKNKITDIFSGSTDAGILVMTDDTNGDALFVEDIYTSFGKDAARFAQIDEIRAGNGDDIVDMTSQRFAYIGDGVKIYGGLGNDTIWANNGNNVLFGDAGNDRLVGAGGNDVIVGGIGNDSMHGGGGEDIFCFGENFGSDTIEELDGGKITLRFESGEMSNWNADTLTYSDGTNSVKVSGVSNDNITLIFGDDGSLRYDELATIGCFDDAASEKIFEDKNKGMLA